MYSKNSYVTTFHAGLANGVQGAVQYLDECVASLGDVQIDEVNDVLHEDNKLNGSPIMLRRVLYRKSCFST